LVILKSDLPTKVICNKGFRGNSSILPRSNFGVGGLESSPQSLTAYSLIRYPLLGNTKMQNFGMTIFCDFEMKKC